MTEYKISTVSIVHRVSVIVVYLPDAPGQDSATSARGHETEQISPPSQFLREIPPATVVETRPRVSVQRPVYQPRPQRASAPRPIADDSGVAGLKLGQRVAHKSFGEGTITSFDGDGDRVRVEVRFREAGTKWLMLSYANLQPL